MHTLPIVPKLFLGAALALALGGCANRDVIHTGAPKTMATHVETPIAVNFPASAQPKLQAGQHWIDIADDAGRAVAEALRRGKFCPPRPAACNLVYVEPPDVVTGFSRAFHNQLITTLVNQGVAVSRLADTELVVQVDVQPVLFSENRPQYRHAGSPTELAPGIWALRDVAVTDPPKPGAVPPKSGALHWFRTEFAGGQTPRAEILVTVSIGDRVRYLARVSHAYYVADTDQRLYDEELCSLFKLCPVEKPPSCACPANSDGKGGCTCPSPKLVKIIGDCPVDSPCPQPATAKTGTKGKKSK